MASAFSQNAPPPQGGLEQDKRHLGAPSPHFEGRLSMHREAKIRGPARGRPKNTGDDARLDLYCVIPGRAKGANPESILRSRCISLCRSDHIINHQTSTAAYGFRVHAP
jgi:hypothetical protein